MRIAAMDFLRSEISNLKISNLPLRELEALASAFLSVLLPLFDSRIARDQSRLLQRWPQVRVVTNQRPSNTMTNRARLACWTTAGDIHQHIEFVRRLSQVQRLANDHSQRFIGEVRFERLVINLDVAGAGAQ